MLDLDALSARQDEDYLNIERKRMSSEESK